MGRTADGISQYLESALALDYSGAQAMLLLLWVSTPTGATLSRVLAAQGPFSVNGNWLLEAHTTAPDNRMYVINGGAQESSTLATEPYDSWHQLGYVVDVTDAPVTAKSYVPKIYLDGVPQTLSSQTTSTRTGIHLSNDFLELFRYTGGLYKVGSIGQVGIWVAGSVAALPSDANVLASYTAGYGGLPTPTDWWPMVGASLANNIGGRPALSNFGCTPSSSDPPSGAPSVKKNFYLPQTIVTF